MNVARAIRHGRPAESDAQDSWEPAGKPCLARASPRGSGFFRICPFASNCNE